MRRLFSNYRDALTSALPTFFHIFAFSTKCRDQKDFELHATLTTDPQGVQRAQNGRRSQLHAICNLSFHLPLASFCFLLSFSCSCSIFTIFVKSWFHIGELLGLIMNFVGFCKVFGPNQCPHKELTYEKGEASLKLHVPYYFFGIRKQLTILTEPNTCQSLIVKLRIA